MSRLGDHRERARRAARGVAGWSWSISAAAAVAALWPASAHAAGAHDAGSAAGSPAFPLPLADYGDPAGGVLAVLAHRIAREPFNLVATGIFVAAIVHTFSASKLLALSHRWEHEHALRQERGEVPRTSVPQAARLLHFLGEVETVFGIWAVALVAAIAVRFGWDTAVAYVSHDVNFTEALFVVVIMTLASTRPILKLAERMMAGVAALLGGSLAAWWLTILSFGPLLGSFITEPAAMTISALLLSDKFFSLGPSTRFKYATLGLLFVNVSIGGTLTHYAAPPVLMVAGPWGWDTPFMLATFGARAAVAVVLSTLVYAALFRAELRSLSAEFAKQELMDRIRRAYVDRGSVEREFDRIVRETDAEAEFTEGIRARVAELSSRAASELRKHFLEVSLDEGTPRPMAEEAFDKVWAEVMRDRLRRQVPQVLPAAERAPYVDPDWDQREEPVAVWVTLVHVALIVWTVACAHHPQLFIAGLLFFLAFARITEHHQNRVDIRGPLLVGFFLGGLVVHGGLQGWWIEPVLGSLSELPLLITSALLTSFNDNAAITYLSTLVPNFSDGAKYAVVAGAVTGGGLTVIANAPNPAGQAILKDRFDGGVLPGGLLLGALVPTFVAFAAFALFR